jgi:hypothetical protein
MNFDLAFVPNKLAWSRTSKPWRVKQMLTMKCPSGMDVVNFLKCP